MTAAQLIEILKRMTPTAKIRAMDIYGEVDYNGSGFPINGVVYDSTEIILTNEDYS